MASVTATISTGEYDNYFESRDAAGRLAVGLAQWLVMDSKPPLADATLPSVKAEIQERQQSPEEQQVETETSAASPEAISVEEQDQSMEEAGLDIDSEREEMPKRRSSHKKAHTDETLATEWSSQGYVYILLLTVHCFFWPFLLTYSYYFQGPQHLHLWFSSRLHWM